MSKFENKIWQHNDLQNKYIKSEFDIISNKLCLDKINCTPYPTLISIDNYMSLAEEEGEYCFETDSHNIDSKPKFIDINNASELLCKPNQKLKQTRLIEKLRETSGELQTVFNDFNTMIDEKKKELNELKTFNITFEF